MRSKVAFLRSTPIASGVDAPLASRERKRRVFRPATVPYAPELPSSLRKDTVKHDGNGGGQDVRSAQRPAGERGI